MPKTFNIAKADATVFKTAAAELSIAISDWSIEVNSDGFYECAKTIFGLLATDWLECVFDNTDNEIYSAAQILPKPLITANTLTIYAKNIPLSSLTLTYKIFAGSEIGGGTISCAAIGCSSAGHTIQNNGTSLTARANLNFVAANSESIATDDSANNQSDITPKLRGMNDYNASGEAAGYLIGRNSANNGFESIPVALFDLTILSSVANISADGDIGIDVPAGYRFTLLAKNETANAITNFKVTDGTNDLVTAANIAASGFTVYNMDATKMNVTNDLNINVAAGTWNSGMVTLYFRFERVI